jgi:alpha-N-acetylglucosaminidase
LKVLTIFRRGWFTVFQRGRVTVFRRGWNHLFLTGLACLAGSGMIHAQLHRDASYAMIQRIMHEKVSSFVIESLPVAAGKDSFELESRGDRIVLRGNNGVAIASALYYYLTEFCHCQVTWNGTNLRLPARLPIVPKKIHRQSPYRYRYYLNYCTFNYSMAWWDWDRWQQEIDWMALHGINMPLAITGEEYTWHQVYRKMGFTDEELKNFFSGPA